MKKAIVCTLVFLASTSSAFATPTTKLDDNAKSMSVSYFSHNIDTNFARPTLVSGKWTTNVDMLFKVSNGSKVSNFIEGGIQYAISDNFAVATGYAFGNVYASQDDTTSKFNEFYGEAVYNQKLNENTHVYASYLKGAKLEDWRTGMTFATSDSSYLDVGYRHFKITNSTTMNGVNVGHSWTF